MKTTLEIDDEVYREAKAMAALTGRKMKDLVTEGLKLVLLPAQSKSKVDASKKLQACFTEADKLLKAAPKGKSARSHLNETRNRLEKA